MMPIKEILNQRHLTPRPPVLVIDETNLKCSDDAGPICGCDEKYDLIKRYKPFIPGAVNPYDRRKIPDTGCLEVYWKRLKIGEEQLIFDKPVAIHPSELPKNFKPPKGRENPMQMKPHKYTDDYIMEKLRQCPREHSEECSCPDNEITKQERRWAARRDVEDKSSEEKEKKFATMSGMIFE